MIEDGRAEIAPMMEAGRVHRFKKGSGLPIKAPVIDMIEIGAGGGSIAAIDEVGLLRVGPHSAGSAPGPACYGMGGTQAHRDRRQPRARLLRPRLLPRRPHEARPRSRAPRRRTAWPSRWASRSRRPRSASTRSSSRAWPPPRACISSRRARTRATTPWSASAAQGRPTPRKSPACSACSELIIPPASGAASALGFLAAPLSFELVRSHPVEFSADFDARRPSTRSSTISKRRAAPA